MSEKIELKEKIAFVDMGLKGVWDEMDTEQQKALKNELFILNRYISSVRSNNKEVQEHFILTVNEYFNKHWFDLSKHPKLMWQLLCMCAYENKKQFSHEWIGFKKKPSNKLYKFLQEVYPNIENAELEVLVAMTTKAEAKDLARAHGYDEKEIAKLF
jgi:hypothetical protein